VDVTECVIEDIHKQYATAKRHDERLLNSAAQPPLTFAVITVKTIDDSVGKVEFRRISMTLKNKTQYS
jgi:hypothetical protein